jgi:hypothetical protein
MLRAHDLADDPALDNGADLDRFGKERAALRRPRI